MYTFPPTFAVGDTAVFCSWRLPGCPHIWPSGACPRGYSTGRFLALRRAIAAKEPRGSSTHYSGGTSIALSFCGDNTTSFFSLNHFHPRRNEASFRPSGHQSMAIDNPLDMGFSIGHLPKLEAFPAMFDDRRLKPGKSVGQEVKPVQAW